MSPELTKQKARGTTSEPQVETCGQAPENLRSSARNPADQAPGRKLPQKRTTKIGACTFFVQEDFNHRLIGRTSSP